MTGKTTKPTFEDLTKGTPFEGKTQDAVKQALYTAAMQDLRNEHLAEFQEAVTASYAAYGLTYKKRLTEQEKAEQQVRALLSAHPELAAKFAAEVGSNEDEVTPVEDPAV
jgi:hypothetical protein